MEEKFSLPESSWDILGKIILGYFATGSRRDKFSQQDVANRIGIDKTTISRNNKFLVSIGILKKEDNQYLLSSEGNALGLALEHDSKERIQQSLYKCISQSDFISQIIDSVRIRGGMDYDTLVSHVMMVANLPKEARYRTGSAALIDILLISGCIVKDGNFITVVKDVDIKVHVMNIGPTATSEVGTSDNNRSIDVRNIKGSHYSIIVKLDIAITAQDLIDNGADIGKKLKDLLNYLDENEGE